MSTKEIDQMLYPDHYPPEVELYPAGMNPPSLQNRKPRSGVVDWEYLSIVIPGAHHYITTERDMKMSDQISEAENAGSIYRGAFGWVRVARDRASKTTVYNIRAGRNAFIDPERFEIHAEKVSHDPPLWDYYVRVRPMSQFADGPENNQHMQWIADARRAWIDTHAPRIKKQVREGVTPWRV